MTLSRAQGCGQQRGRVGIREDGDGAAVLRPKVRLEAAVRDDLVDSALEAMVRGARTYHLGDGMVFVYEVADCLRIRTRARGHGALEQKTSAGAAKPLTTGEAFRHGVQQ